MSKLTDNDLFIRIISILIGVILWYTVLNTSNPVMSKTISLPLKILNENTIEDNSFGILSREYEETVDVVVKGRSSYIDAVSLNDISAYVDFAKANKAGENQIEVQIDNADEKLSVVSNSPNVISIYLEEIVEKTFDIFIETNGDIRSGYVMIESSANPKKITVKGYKSVLDNVSLVKAIVDIEGLDRDLEVTENCAFYNERGELIESINENQKVDVFVSVAKPVSVIPVVEGEPKEGYYYDGIISYVDKIFIKGSPDVISQIDEVRTRPIDLTDKEETYEVDLELVTPGNAQVASIEGQLKANVGISKFDKKDVLIRSSDISLVNTDYLDYLYDIVSDSLEIVIEGKPNELNNFYKSDFEIVADVGELETGLNKVKLEIEYDKDVRLIGEYEAVIRVTERVKETPIEETDNTTTFNDMIGGRLDG